MICNKELPKDKLTISYLDLLKNQIDLTRVPFSDRGSRLLVNQAPGQSRLTVKLAERLIRVEPGLETYLKRAPFLQDLSLIDEQGEALDFEVTTFAEMLEFQTRIGTFRLVFQDACTLSFGLPGNVNSGLRFQAQARLHRDGEWKHVRNLHYATNGHFIFEEVRGEEIKLIVAADEDTAITLHISDDAAPETLPFSQAYANARARWESWFERVPPAAERYREKYACAWWVMGNNLISPLRHIQYEAMMPTKAFYLGVWLWDSALHAVAFRHADPKLARDQLRAMLAHQLEDGMLPDAIFDEGVVSEIDHPFPGRVTKPPLMAWAALKIHEVDADVEFLREIYPSLVRNVDWWLMDANKLAHYAHPYSSGLDNSPLWDHGMPLISADINTYLYIKMISLAKIAEIIGLKEDCVKWHERAAAHLQCMLETLWDEKAGVFQSLHHDQPIPVLTPFNLYPLWTGALPTEINQRLIAHLKDSAEFFGTYMLPTVARDDPAYDPQAMWRGPVWANINYFFIEALQKVGEHELARDLRDKTLKMIMDQPGVREYYNPQNGEAPATAANMFGWTAAVFIELALQATADSAI